MPKSVLITGGSRGIGAATAIHFARMGYKVAITYNQSAEAAKALKQTMDLNKAEFLAIKADCQNPLQVESAIKQTVSAFGSLDVMVNNAGIALQKLITQTGDDEWQKILNTNLSGVFYGCREASKIMVAKGRGSIVNISSIWGLYGASMEVAYSATKAGIIGLTKALAKELGPSGIRVNCVAPGVIDTDMNSNLDLNTFSELAEATALGRIGTPDEVARAIYYLANDADFITGQVLGTDGGFC
jgi:3-oxoacyl-[acyl-carrier protein] reductase